MGVDCRSNKTDGGGIMIDDHQYYHDQEESELKKDVDQERENEGGVKKEAQPEECYKKT